MTAFLTYLENPLRSKIVKSPTSWGISCMRIDAEVTRPSLILAKNQVCPLTQLDHVFLFEIIDLH